MNRPPRFNKIAQGCCILALVAACVMLASCGGGKSNPGDGTIVSSTTPLQPPSSSNANVMPMTIDGAVSKTTLNVPTVSVTICVPGTTNCQTIDHVLVDTGSYGLRLMSSAMSSYSSLPSATNSAGQAVGECAQFVSGYTWGSVRFADVHLSSEVASNIPIEVIGDSGAPYADTPSDCAAAGANVGSVSAEGINGIMGVGLESQDCGSTCETVVVPTLYYGCTAAGVCTGTTIALKSQVVNPVAAFPVDNNGVQLVLPSVPAGGATTLTGSLIFGVGTQSNNTQGSATVYKADGYDNFITVYKNVTYSQSFIDSGSNGYFFPDSTIPTCSSSNPWFCPTTSPLALTAVNKSFDGSTSGNVSFSLTAYTSLVSGALVGDIGADTTGSGLGFDWGLPFFLGRTVTVVMNGAKGPGGAGPYWAY